MIVKALLITMGALASVESPKAVVQNIFSNASEQEIATSRDKQAEINSLVDFDALAKAALGREARSLPKKEVEWFRDTLREIITLTVYPKAPDFLKDVKITYESVEEKGQKATVSSSVQNKADFTDVKYQMARSKDGLWKVVDVSIAGLSWVDSINDQVRDTVKKRQWKGLKDAMNKRLNELKAGKST